MLAKELIAQVKRLEIRTRRVVDELMGGAYHSRFKGRGMEFDEVREYIPGDDVRDIDWNVTARLGIPFIKKYVEERELHVMVAVDVSASELYGSGEKSKIRVAAELGSLLTLSAIRNHDKVGMITFTHKIETHVPAKAGRGHALRLIRELVGVQPEDPKTDIAFALAHLRQTLKRKSVIFVISDLQQKTPEWEKELSLLSHKHDVILIHIKDPKEYEWNVPGYWELEDSESGRLFSWHATKARRELYAKHALEREAHLKSLCTKSKAGYISVQCDEDLVSPLMRYFNTRKR